MGASESMAAALGKGNKRAPAPRALAPRSWCHAGHELASRAPPPSPSSLGCSPEHCDLPLTSRPYSCCRSGRGLLPFNLPAPVPVPTASPAPPVGYSAPVAAEVVAAVPDLGLLLQHRVLALVELDSSRSTGLPASLTHGSVLGSVPAEPGAGAGHGCSPVFL